MDFLNIMLTDPILFRYFVMLNFAFKLWQEEDTLKCFEAGALNSEKADGRLFLLGSRCYN